MMNKRIQDIQDAVLFTLSMFGAVFAVAVIAWGFSVLFS